MQLSVRPVRRVAKPLKYLQDDLDLRTEDITQLKPAEELLSLKRLAIQAIVEKQPTLNEISYEKRAIMQDNTSIFMNEINKYYFRYNKATMIQARFRGNQNRVQTGPFLKRIKDQIREQKTRKSMREYDWDFMREKSGWLLLKVYGLVLVCF